MIVQYLPATEFRRPPSQKTSEGYRERQRLKFDVHRWTVEAPRRGDPWARSKTTGGKNQARAAATSTSRDRQRIGPLSVAPLLPSRSSEVSKPDEPNADLVRPREATPVDWVANSGWQKAGWFPDRSGGPTPMSQDDVVVEATASKKAQQQWRETELVGKEVLEFCIAIKALQKGAGEIGRLKPIGYFGQFPHPSPPWRSPLLIYVSARHVTGVWRLLRVPRPSGNDGPAHEVSEWHTPGHANTGSPTGGLIQTGPIHVSIERHATFASGDNPVNGLWRTAQITTDLAQ